MTPLCVPGVPGLDLVRRSAARVAALAWLAVLAACGGGEAILPEPPAVASGRPSLRVVLDTATPAPVSGSVLVLRSESLGEEGSPTPGPGPAYDGRFERVHAAALVPGAALALPVPGGGGAVCAYLDPRREFMQHFGVGEGGYYSSRCASAAEVDAGSAVLRLDRRVEPRAASEFRAPRAVDHTVRAQVEGGPLEVPLLVFLPEDYESSGARYPVLYLFHGFGGDRFSAEPQIQLFRRHMEESGRRMIIASVEGNGRFGPHLFVNSEANGRARDALLEHVIPWVDRSFRTRAEPGGRVALGHSSGGWVALSLLLEQPETIGFAFASSPDPLHLATWWQKQPGNVYLDAAGREHALLEAPGFTVSFRSLVGQEVRSGSFGQFASFLGVFSPFQPEREPFPFALPFDLESGAVDPAGWRAWEEHDLYLATARDPERARRALAGRLFLYAGERDEFDLDTTTAEYSRLLGELGIAHEFELRDAGHFSDANSPQFWAGIWDRAWRAVTQPERAEP